MHPFADSDPHEGHGSILGHFEESISGRSPDHMTTERAAQLVPHLTRYFEVVTGVSADTVLDGYSESIGERAKSDVTFALRAAGAGGAIGADFERQFNLSARSLMPEGALVLPTLPGLVPDYLWNNTPEGAYLQTEQYLASINLKANPGKFLVNALDSYVTIANRYLTVVDGRLSSGEVVEPIDRHRVLPNPSPIQPLVPNFI